MLTALAQAGAFQTGTDRSLVSLFDADYQYVVAESTPTSRLQPSVRSQDCHTPLWLCGTAIPRSHGVCELSLLGEHADDGDGAVRENLTDAEQLPSPWPTILLWILDFVLSPIASLEPCVVSTRLCPFAHAVASISACTALSMRRLVRSGLTSIHNDYEIYPVPSWNISKRNDWEICIDGINA